MASVGAALAVGATAGWRAASGAFGWECTEELAVAFEEDMIPCGWDAIEKKKRET